MWSKRQQATIPVPWRATFGSPVTGPSLHVRKRVDRPKRLFESPAGRGPDTDLDRRSNPAERTGSRRPTGHVLRREQTQVHPCARSGADGVRVFLLDGCAFGHMRRATRPNRVEHHGQADRACLRAAKPRKRPRSPGRPALHLRTRTPTESQDEERDAKRVRARSCACTGARSR